ncbi:Tetratricopeptide repeat-containing protein [Nannocystis exedens]|uniref:Tetratricopeptide repeat-containing protein n=1 Tax=Nannocystis exedens TaxID=54 RepID=A0A1I2H8H4_9BACT|nr:serine/threonine-protein kinase [Nannocystis exedens]PCC73987.1 serine/threonine kinase family protein [Nannocystis exedens]SFF24921.1 Tetratricopeptide repeat-containing protein [Nannocystis exedens]
MNALASSPHSTAIGDDPRDIAGDLAAEAVRRRLQAQLFGVAADPVFLGRFRVVRLLGQGGMGRVYAAEDDQLERLVAVKVIRPDGAARAAGERDRLLREARALARLSHPNVVQVYEVGEHEQDIFIAMEHVSGLTVDRWLAAGPRTLAEVLDVFIAAGRGLAAAHGANITHRDFKPNNVIVGDDGRVRILDFGLARPVGDTAATHPSPGAATSAAAGTPAYMSPEQRAGRADARSDQFSFCVALAEAVDRRAPPGPAPKWLRRALGRGTAADPERRFATMEPLLAALARGRDRPRRRLRAALGCTAIAAAVGAGALVSAPSPPCADLGAPLVELWSHDRKDRIERTLAGLPGADSPAQARRVLADLDDWARRWHLARVDACAATRVRGEQSEQLLDRSAACLDRGLQRFAELTALLTRPDPARLAAAPELLAALPDPAACRDRQALARDAHAAAVGPRVAGLRRGLDVAHFLQLARRGPAALAEARHVLEDSLAADEPALAAEAQLRVGVIHSRLFHDPERAAAALHDAHARAVAADRHDLMWAIWNELARVDAFDREDPARARLWLTNARSARADAGPDARIDADLLETEALVALAESDPPTAIARARDAIALRHSDDPERLFSRMLLGNAIAEAGRLDEAAALLGACVDEARVERGRDSPAAAWLEHSLARVQLARGRSAEATSLLQHAREVLLAIDGPAGFRVATIDLALARAAAAARDFEAAIVSAEAALVGLEAAFGPAYSDRLTALAELAELYRLTGRHADALAVNRRLLALADAYGLDLDLPALLVNIGDYLCLLDRCGEALPYYARLAATLAEHAPDDPGLVAYSLQGIARAHLAAGAPSQALPLLEEAHRKLRAHPETSPAIAAQTARLLAQCLRSLGREPRRIRALEAEARALEPR